MKKILVIYGSVGLGHKVVAQNIAAALRVRADVEVSMLDVLELYRGPFTNTSAKIYEFIIKHIPSLWGFFYTNSIFQKLSLPLRIPFASLKSKKFNEYVEKIRPDLILTTHPTATALTINLKNKGKFQGPIITTFSDFHFQPYWVYAGVNKYLVMTEEQKQEVLERGFSARQVVITGLPVDPIFSQPTSREEILSQLNLSRALPIILIMGGSRGWGVKISDLKALLSANLPAQFLVVTGINPELQGELEKLKQTTKASLKVFGSWSNEEVAKLFNVASILVTKPGGLSIAQAVLKNLPMVLVNPLPTMEELNQAYLLKYGAALSAKNSNELVSCVKKLLTDEKFRSNLKMNLQKISHPDAAQIAASAIIDSLQS